MEGVKDYTQLEEEKENGPETRVHTAEGKVPVAGSVIFSSTPNRLRAAASAPAAKPAHEPEPWSLKSLLLTIAHSRPMPKAIR